jgi:aminoglycoside phosphotransferase family enzyme
MASVQYSPSTIKVGEPTLAEKVAFLSQGAAYPRPVSNVIRRETHMSWVFLADDEVYKLKILIMLPLASRE